MPLKCDNCQAEVPHTCAPENTTDEAVQTCPEAQKGVVWVNVTDVTGKSIGSVKVKVGEAELVTDPGGFATSEPLDAGTETVSLPGAFSGNQKHFHLLEQHSKQTPVTNGQISLVELKLGCWIEVRVEDPEQKTVDDVELVITHVDGSEENKRTKEALIEDSHYRVDKLKPGDCDISFPELYDDEWSIKE